MDVALHRLPVTFVLDRAGITGEDGPSHNGMWDLALLGVVPGLRIAAPRDEPPLRAQLREAVARDRVAQLGPQPRLVARGSDVYARDDAQDRKIPHAVVRGAVVAGDPRPVEDERDRQLVQRDVEQHLVERAVEKGRVDGDDRVQPTRREPGRGGDGVLFGDADIEGALREAATELAEAGRLAHRGGDRHDVVALFADAHELVGEHVRPGASGAGQRNAGLRVEPAGLVHLVGLVVLCGRVAVALAGDAVDDDRPAQKPRASANAFSSDSTSCPSTGPRYFRPRSSNIPCGETRSLMPRLTPWSAS